MHTYCGLCVVDLNNFVACSQRMLCNIKQIYHYDLVHQSLHIFVYFSEFSSCHPVITATEIA